MRAKPFPERARKAGPRMLEQLERQETQEQLVIPRLEIAALPAPMVVENDQRQRRRMVIALVVLLIALGLVLIKDRDFWFPATDVADSEAVEDSSAEPANDAGRDQHWHSGGLLADNYSKQEKGPFCSGRGHQARASCRLQRTGSDRQPCCTTPAAGGRRRR